MTAEQERRTDGEPTEEEGPSNPDESVPSEEEAAEDLPGVPDDSEERPESDRAASDARGRLTRAPRRGRLAVSKT